MRTYTDVSVSAIFITGSTYTHRVGWLHGGDIIHGTFAPNLKAGRNETVLC